MRSDILIIGGGIIGCASAYYLAKSGAEVTVVEKSQIGNGGSCRNGGGVRGSGRDLRELPLVTHSIKNIWHTLGEELDTDIEYCQEGNLRLGKTDEHMRILTAIAEKGKKAGLDVEIIDSARVREINPYISEEVIGASWCKTDGHANPLMTTLGYYKAARKLGVSFVTGEDVVGLKRVRGRVGRAKTKQSTYEANTIILAAGYNSREILNTASLDIPMRRILLETLVTESCPPMFSQMIGTAKADFYGHQTAHGSFVFGGSSGYEPYSVQANGEILQTANLPQTAEAIISYIPSLKNVKVLRAWSGFIDYCLDGVPVIDIADEGLVVACGFTGHGFGLAPAAGAAAADLAKFGKTDIDISGLKYTRF
ncbi:FAD-binding oxidoreductase [Clostridia bacterium]|nr:FAD-binding oxidoreductase [Clostridia bacterium]